MRLAAFGDIHGNLPALDAVMDDIAAQGEFDQYWCLGDLAALGGQPSQCLDRLRQWRDQLGEDKLKIIGGNTDRYLVTGQRMAMSPPADAAQYPAHREGILAMSDINAWTMRQLDWQGFELLSGILGQELRHKLSGYGTVIGFHAIPGDDESVALRPDSPEEEALDALLDRQGKLALCGHTHLAMDREVGGWRVINPGSVGLSFGKPGCAEWALVEWRDSQLQAQLRALPYDVEAALRHWESLGYPRMDWIRARLSS